MSYGKKSSSPKTAEVELIYERCCGLDVHKNLIVACFRDGTKKTIREFSAMSKDLRELAEWLISMDCEMVAIESTEPYWKPVYNVLEVLGINMMVVNAHHMKNVPGRKTDKDDAAWISKLLAQGLLNASFIPDREQRELRDTTRYRKSLTEERAREINRLGKVLEGSNIKLTSVVKSVLGKSSRKLLVATMEGEILDEETIQSLIEKSMVGKLSILVDAMDGVLSKGNKFLIRKQFEHIDDLPQRIAKIDRFIEEDMKKYDEAIKRLTKMPGIGMASAEVILTEIGLDMNQFPTANHLAAWSGLALGNNISAGKSKGGKTRKGNITLKTTMIQCAQAATMSKDTFYRVQYDRLVVRNTPIEDVTFYLMDESGHLYNTYKIINVITKTDQAPDDDEPVCQPDGLIYTEFEHGFLSQDIRIAFYCRDCEKINIINLKH